MKLDLLMNAVYFNLKSRGIAKPDLCIRLCFLSRREAWISEPWGLGGGHTPGPSLLVWESRHGCPGPSPLTKAPAAHIPSVNVCWAAALGEAVPGSMGCSGYGGYGMGHTSALKEITEQERR